MHLIDLFVEDLKHIGVTEAINKLENRVNYFDLDQNEFLKYNSFANIMLIIDEMYCLLKRTSVNSREINLNCMRAIAVGIAGTLGLVACATSVNLFCIAAIIAKIDSYITFFLDCKEPSIKEPEDSEDP